VFSSARADREHVRECEGAALDCQRTSWRARSLRVIDVPLQFVVGKGGVGKSTLTAALALESASRGLRTLAIEFGGRGGLARLFDAGDIRPGVPRVVAPRVTLLALEGDEALAEYLGMVVPIKRVLSAVFASRLYRVFVAGAPGLKELMTVGKVWYEVDRRMADGEPVWQRVFVDAGASGHSLQYLQMPSAAAAAFRSGLVHREAVRVQSLLADPEKSCVHVVAIPEEMPVTEACNIIEKLRTGLGLPVGTLFMNRCRAPAPDGAREAAALLESLDVEPADEPLRRAMQGSAIAALDWEAVQEHAIERLETWTGIRTERLPLLVREEFGLREATELVDLLRRRRSGSTNGAAAPGALS
jgi:anion-transporting  ArsA/GET3 family ATPase